MKKFVVIISLIVFNVLLLYSKVSSKSDINLKLDKNELAIIVINNDDSKALLLLKDNKSILYILEYNNDKKLLKNLEKFTYNFDYIYENDLYDIPLDRKELIYTNMIDNIYLSKNRISYLNYTFCINESYCDFTYLTGDYEIKETNNIIYSDNISEKTKDLYEQEWIDLYKISNNNYLIIFIKDDNYEITNLMR